MSPVPSIKAIAVQTLDSLIALIVTILLVQLVSQQAYANRCSDVYSDQARLMQTDGGSSDMSARYDKHV